MAFGGKLKIEQNLTLSEESFDLVGDSSDSEIDLSGGGSILIQSPVTSLPSLSSDINAGTSSVAFSSAHGLEKGEVIAVWNPTDFSFSAHRNYYRDGCMFRVSNITDTENIRVYGVSPSTFEFADVECFKITGKKVNLENITITPGSTGIPLWIDGHQNVTLSDVATRDGASNTAIEIYRCYDVKIKRPSSVVSSGDAYPIVLANSQRIVADNLSNYSTRHVIAFGGRSGDASVPTRDILVSNSILEHGS